eukprot:5276264-Pleurochrysis_carterae.AAC.1
MAVLSVEAVDQQLFAFFGQALTSADAESGAAAATVKAEKSSNASLRLSTGPFPSPWMIQWTAKGLGVQYQSHFESGRRNASRKKKSNLDFLS